MVLSSAANYSINDKKFSETDRETESNSKNNIKLIRQNGQIHIYQSAYRGSFSTVIRDSLRNAALGRKVLLAQLMRGGVDQGVSNPVNLCGNLIWIRSYNSYDQHKPEDIKNNEVLSKSIRDSTIELWEFCKKQLLSGEQDQIILDEIFKAVELGFIDSEDLISTLESRFISGDVILTGTTIPKKLLLIADQVTELRS
ncbi:MAG: cob(I)alamin adenolsyltransferase [Prochlorococcus sp. SP3034]|mgnify:CR=1 FL=1|nr:cob(I)alamin adenolsyltransferase [Prochlorococcus sp. SP3034]|tara:strand:+ start:4120 stop:4713 length:594 start_codon:yes stop_codon:yes gene_type:complete